MFGRNLPARDPDANPAKYWAARGGRGEYWVMVGFFFGMSLLLPGFSTTVAAGPLMIFTIRRLHDFGQSGWWAAAPLAVGLAAGIAMAASPLLAPIIQAVLLVGSVSFTAFVGLMPGDAGPNRFGETQPLFRRKRPDLSETFS